MHCYRSYRPIITLRGAIVAGIMSKKGAGKKNHSFRRTRCACLWEARKRMRNISADDIVRFLTHFGVSRAIKDYVMEDGPLGRPQRPRPAKRSGECDHDAVQVAVEGKILKSCAVAPSKTAITWKKWILPGITMKNLLSMARGSYTRVSCLMSPAKVRSGPSLSFRCS